MSRSPSSSKSEGLMSACVSQTPYDKRRNVYDIPMSLEPQLGHSSRTIAVAVLPFAVFLIFTFCMRQSETVSTPSNTEL